MSSGHAFNELWFAQLFVDFVRTQDVTIVGFAGLCQVFCCSHWEHELTQDRSLSPLQNASSFDASWFACTAYFNGTGSAKLPFFQKAAAIVMIVDLACIEEWRNRERQMHERKHNIRANACKQCEKEGEGVFQGA